MEHEEEKSILRRAREAAGISQAELASRLESSTGRDWDQSKVSRYENNPEDAPHWAVVAMQRELGVEDIEVVPTDPASSTPGVDAGDALAPLHRDLTMLENYVDSHDWSSPDPDVDVPDIDTLRSLCGLLRRKPTVALFGRFDVGKSTIVNTLLGSRVLPTSYQPATRVITHVRHLDDRPPWLLEDVLMLDDGFDTERWKDEKHCLQHKVAAGGLETLQAHGSHRGSQSDSAAAKAMVFVDAPILRVCDIADLPGTDNTTTDTKRAEAKTVSFDVAIFSDTATSFLEEGALTRLAEVIRQLPIISTPAGPEPLRNLYVVATQAHRDINDQQLREQILTGALKRAWRFLGDSDGDSDAQTATVLAERGQVAGVSITINDFAARFFSFYREIATRRQPLLDDIKALLGTTVPQVLNMEADTKIEQFKEESTEYLCQTIDIYRKTVHDRADVEAQYQALLAEEPRRKKVTGYARKAVEAAIAQHRVEMVEDIRQYIRKNTSKDAIEKLIDKKFKDKKDAQRNAAALVIERIQSRAEQQARQRTEKVTQLIEEFIDEYDQATMTGPSGPGRIKVPFNAKGAFAGGLVGLASVGGLAMWASTLGNLGAYIIVAKAASVASAVGLSLGGSVAWTTFVAAIGGPVTIAIGIVILAGVLGFALFRSSWKGRLAKRIAEELRKSHIERTYLANIETYWDDTETAFAAGADNAEQVWLEHLDDLARLVNETDLDTLNEWISRLGELRDFFQALPWRPAEG